MSASHVRISKKGFKDNEARIFREKRGDSEISGFVVKKEGKYYAYRNVCRHLPIALDIGDSGVFTHDNKYLQCHLHGAVYEIETGLCIGGPCEGASLGTLPFAEEEDAIFVELPLQS